MKLGLSWLFLAFLHVHSSWSVSSGTLIVTQIPDVSVMEGEDVNISCCWEGDFDRVIINWQKKQTKVKSEVFNSENGTKESQQKVTSGCSHLTFPNITKANSGRYTCKLTVVIPSYAQVNGSGTVITVTDKENTTDYSTEGVSSGTLVVTQAPDVSVMEGEDVKITCCWKGDFERGTINWQKKQTDIKSEVFNFMYGTKESQQEVTSGCSHLTFPNIMKANSGRYTCTLTVDIPSYAQVNGSGTVITVTSREGITDKAAEDDHSGIEWIHLLRCLPLLALILSFFLINKWGTKALQQAPGAPGNTIPSAQGTEEEGEGEEREVQAEGGDVE
ncbi:uncharacterized protein LOC117807191 isoform X2 [Notolabrus celidotus]|uniref:uncharacterized protein LOC117807191 isoform X2 n=1 Tax=Notolabrus celidotus TaxID=1203425 RepID=UPI00148FEFB1|nr:uncharacterized protein LOC117807191 isoform X2 [Notolabrus celidotus]